MADTLMSSLTGNNFANRLTKCMDSFPIKGRFKYTTDLVSIILNIQNSLLLSKIIVNSQKSSKVKSLTVKSLIMSVVKLILWYT